MEPQSNIMLPGMSSAPMASGIAPMYQYGMEGMPLPHQSDPRFALAGQFLLAPKVRQMMSTGGFAPMGLGHDQNIADTIAKQNYTQMQMRAIQDAAQNDRENMFKTFRGMSAMAGVGFGAEQRRAAGSLADMTAMASPMLAAMNPELLDQMGGTRGSAAVMAKRVIDASRYRLDPITGRMGTSQESLRDMSSHLFKDLFMGSERQMGALTAGQTGSLFSELTNRGMMHGDSRTVHQRAYGAISEMQRTDPAGLARAAKTAGVTTPGEMSKISAEDIDKLTMAPEVSTRLRSFDAEKIKRSLKSYAGAVTAMRDIFGDMGHPNAPMSELMGGLEALTMGSMSQMDPARAGQIARQTYNLAKQTGVTMDSAMVLQQHAGARAQQLGLDPIFAVHATQGALAFGGAYRAQGHGAHTAFGAFNADQMTQLDANLRLQASGSNMANQLGTAMRIRESAGGMKAGSDAERFTTAIASGVGQFKDSSGRIRSLNMNQGEFMSMMRESGVDEGTVRDMLDQRDTNREQIDRYGITNTVRKEQASGEMRPQVALRMGETLHQRLRQTGKLSDDAIRAAVEKASPAAAKRIMEMSTEKFARTGEREAEIGRILGEELGGTEAGGMLAGMSGDDRNQFLRVTAGQFYGNMDRFVRNSGYRGMGSFQNVHRSMNQDVMREAERQQIQARMTGNLQEALAPLGRGTAMQRAIDAMQDVREGDTDSMQKVMIKAFGGVDSKEVNLALQKPLADLARKKTQIQQLTEQASRAPDGEEKVALMTKLDTLMREVTAQTADTVKIGERFGLYRDGGLTKQDTERALKSTSAVARGVLDLSGVRGAFGTSVSDSERSAAAAGYGKGKMTKDEAAVVIMAHRQADVNVSDEEAKKLSEASGGKVSVDQVKSSLYANKMSRIGIISDADMAHEIMNGGIDLGTDRGRAAADALARHKRGKMPLRGSGERVKQLMAGDKDMTELQAQNYADAEARAKRMGVTDAEIDEHLKVAGKDETRFGAINAIISSREDKRYVVTDEQRTAYHKAANLAGKVDLATDEGKKFVDEQILGRRANEETQRFRGFRQSDDGARFREDVDMRNQDVENIMTKLISSPQMMKRFGMFSIKMHDDLKAGQQRLRDLSMLHSGGDMNRLIMGDYDIKSGTVEGAAEAKKVREEVLQVVAQQTHNIAAAHGTHGLEGRQLQLGQTGEALIRSADPDLKPLHNLARRHALISMGMDEKLSFEDVKKSHPGRHQEFLDKFMDEANKLDPTKMHETHQKALLNAREKIGNAEEALGLLGVRQLPHESAEAALERIKKTADDPNADPILKAGHKYALANFEKTAKAVAAARRIKPEDQDMLDRHTDLMSSVEGMASAHNTSAKELAEVLAGGKDVKKWLTSFSGDETAAVARANNQIENAKKETETAENELQGAEFGLAHRKLTPEQRKEHEVARDRAKARITAAKESHEKAITSVDVIAKGRGVTSLELLTTDKGRMTPEQLERARTDLEELGKSTPAVQAMLKERGVTMEQLRDVNSLVTKAAEARQREALDREQTPGLGLLSQFQEAYGGAKIDMTTGDERYKSASSKLGGIEQRRLMQSVIGTQHSLLDQASGATKHLEARLAKFGPDSKEGKEAKALLDRMKNPNDKMAGKNVMVQHFQDAMLADSPTKLVQAMEQFGATFGMDHNDVERFRNSYKLQSKYGTLDYDPNKADKDPSKPQLDTVLDRMQKGGVDHEKPADGSQGATATHVTGVLRLEGNIGFMDAATGGGAAHGGPGG